MEKQGDIKLIELTEIRIVVKTGFYSITGTLNFNTIVVNFPLQLCLLVTVALISSTIDYCFSLFLLTLQFII